MRLVSRVRCALLNLFTSSCTNHLKTQSKRLKVIVIKQPEIILHKLPASCLCMSPLSRRQFFFSFESVPKCTASCRSTNSCRGDHVKLSHGNPLDEDLCCCPCLLENTSDFTDCQVFKKNQRQKEKGFVSEGKRPFCDGSLWSKMILCQSKRNTNNFLFPLTSIRKKWNLTILQIE